MNTGEQSSMMNGPSGDMQHIYGQYSTPGVRHGYPNSQMPPPHPNMPSGGVHPQYNPGRFPMPSSESPAQSSGSTPTLNQLLMTPGQPPRPHGPSYNDYGMAASKGGQDMAGYGPNQWNNQQRPMNSYPPHMHPNAGYRNPVSILLS